MITQKFYRALTENADLISLVGGRVSRNILPQNSGYPAISFFNFAKPSINTLTQESSLDHAMIQVDIWSDADVDEAATIARAVKRAVKDFSEFKALPQMQRDEPYDPDIKAYRISIDFSVWDNEED